jgi:pyridoxamine 5'-phosphate oxidase
VDDQVLAAMRVQYPADGFDVADLAPSWHAQLERWLAEAEAANVAEPNAMVLATADEEGRPSSRTVLCKGLDERGIVFFTNYTSAKSRDLRAVRYASATFPWISLHRQAHLRGTVAPAGAARTLEYWRTRPRGSQLGAWASAQSTVVGERRVLDDALAAVTRRFAGQDVPVPPHWGGWRLMPEQVEFWQGRENRMHDRLRFEADPHDRTWRVRRLAP